MSSIRSEYQGFLAHLVAADPPDQLWRMASIVYEHLDALVGLSATRRARSTRLVPLAEQAWANAQVDREIELPSTHNAAQAFRLEALTVGPFRGFGTQETFDLSRDITLVYGANGTGKSSFCEALEAAMLGSISEAQAKRIDQEKYCDNVRLGRHVPPILTARLDEAQAAAFVADEAAHRFCFIEKNRLDAFARIAARTPGDQRALIATLFGVDQFADFVRNFNQTLDDSLTLVGPKAMRLKALRDELSASDEIIKQWPEKLRTQELAEAELAEQIRPGETYGSACQWLLGTSETKGHLATAQALLDQPAPTVYGATRERLQTPLDEIRRLSKLVAELKAKLTQRAVDVSFAQLYQAVAALSDGATSCPACGTDLALVRENPFERATRGLKELAGLAELQTQLRKNQDALEKCSMELRAEVAQVLNAAQVTRADDLRAAELPPLLERLTEDWFASPEAGTLSAWDRLLLVVRGMEEHDATAREVIAGRADLIAERQRLDPLRLRIETTRAQRKAIEDQHETARAIVTGFNTQNADLIAEVQAEQTVVELHWQIKEGYDAFLSELQSYLADLPARLMQGLNERATELYNAFNRDDRPEDLLLHLSLPRVENEKIEITFAGEPHQKYDALMILSEGHIRCLGLAILLAKNIEQQCSVVVFDDVVNAIDDDHRNGIWRTFFDEGVLDRKQIILTSHAQEFLDRIQQELGSVRAAQIGRFKFLQHLGEHELRVDTDPPSKNYVLQAKNALQLDEKRDALKHARPAIEALTDQLWRWLATRGDGRIELKLAGPRSPWELNNKCVKLGNAVSRVTQQYPAANGAVEALRSLTGLSGSSIEWTYLNGGVHDSDRPHEFDAAAVRTIVQAVVDLDAAVVSLRNPAQ